MTETQWCWIVWAIKRGEARVAAICTDEPTADHYVPNVPGLYRGFKIMKERALMNHAFGRDDGMAALAYYGAPE